MLIGLSIASFTWLRNLSVIGSKLVGITPVTKKAGFASV